MCLAGAAVASWSLTQEVAGSSAFNDKYFLSLNDHLGKNSLMAYRKQKAQHLFRAIHNVDQCH